jgi:nitrous oxidase accessory protein NosD
LARQTNRNEEGKIMRPTFEKRNVRVGMMLALCAIFVVVLSLSAAASTLCVNPSGSHGCYSKIQVAVNHASADDVIEVGAGIYTEQVTIGIPLSLIGAGANVSVIDATGLAQGIFVDGFDNPGLHDVTVAGFTVKNALYEGVLVVSASDVVIRDNNIVNNDTVPGAVFTGELTGCPNQPGSGTYETDETGDCGGALHLVGTVTALVSGNFVTGNADGILVSDETAESRGNVIIHNIFKNNPQGVWHHSCLSSTFGAHFASFRAPLRG